MEENNVNEQQGGRRRRYRGGGSEGQNGERPARNQNAEDGGQNRGNRNRNRGNGNNQNDNQNKNRGNENGDNQGRNRGQNKKNENQNRSRGNENGDQNRNRNNANNQGHRNRGNRNKKKGDQAIYFISKADGTLHDRRCRLIGEQPESEWIQSEEFTPGEGGVCPVCGKTALLRNYTECMDEFHALDRFFAKEKDVPAALLYSLYKDYSIYPYATPSYLNLSCENTHWRIKKDQDTPVLFRNVKEENDPGWFSDYWKEYKIDGEPTMVNAIETILHSPYTPSPEEIARNKAMEKLREEMEAEEANASEDTSNE